MVDLSVLAGIDVDAVADPAARAIIRTLLAMIEQLATENAALRAENQQLKDEIARLKGERGPTRIRPQSRPSERSSNVSSERQRRVPKEWHKAAKLPTRPITRTERLRVDPATLPPDAVFKDVERVVVQDLLLQVETRCFEKEVWYSPAPAAGGSAAPYSTSRRVGR